MLTAAERSAYITAELCLMATPSTLNVRGAQTRWDDLHWNHIVQAHVMHDVVSVLVRTGARLTFKGHFLPWHRYYIVIHANMLRDECGYTGPLP